MWTDLERRLRAVFWLAIIIMGAIHTWSGSHQMGSDGVAYLDIGDAYFQGDWDKAINALWSPFYSWLLGLALVILKPSPFWEFPIVHLVNLAIYLCAFGCFDFFLHELIYYHKQQKEKYSGNRRVTLPSWALLALGYLLFVWSSLYLIDIRRVTPDMCFAAFVYLTFGLQVRIRVGFASWRTFMLLGIALGFGYLAKAPMFTLAFVFLGISIFSAGDLRKAIPKVLVALVIFLTIASPYIAALSKSKGRLTFGDSAKLNYAWFVNHIPGYVHWQGEVPGGGTPQHPTRKLFIDGVVIYEFKTPIGGTYPPWYDPTYWYEGIILHFNLKDQIRALVLSARAYYNLFSTNVQSCLIVGFLTLLLYKNYKFWIGLRDLAEHWNLLVPVFIALGMYSFVQVQDRYVGVFIVILWIGCFSSIQLVESSESRRLVTCVTIAMTMVIVVIMFSLASETVYSKLRTFRQNGGYRHWTIADGMSRVGLNLGDDVAFIGFSDFGYAAFWARLARVRIIAEILPEDSAAFWAANALVKSRVLKAFARIGIKGIVAEYPAPGDSTKGWQRIGNTNYYVIFPDSTLAIEE